MKVDDLLDIVKLRGLSIVIGADGQPLLTGPREEKTEALIECLKLHHKEIIEQLGKLAKTLPAFERHRVFLFRTGQTVRLFGEGNDALAIGSSWWRWSDCPEWTVIPGSPGEQEQPPQEKP